MIFNGCLHLLTQDLAEHHTVFDFFHVGVLRTLSPNFYLLMLLSLY